MGCEQSAAAEFAGAQMSHIHREGLLRRGSGEAADVGPRFSGVSTFGAVFCEEALVVARFSAVVALERVFFDDVVLGAPVFLPPAWKWTSWSRDM